MVEEVILNAFANFGDGNTCLILRKRKYVKEDGITYWEFIFRANPRVAGIYNLKDEVNPIDNSISRDYPATEVFVVDETPNHYRVWIYCDFEGNPTPASRMDDDKDFQILNLQRLKATMELEISELFRQLEGRTSPDAFIEQASELMKKARGSYAKKKDEEEGEDEE